VPSNQDKKTMDTVQYLIIVSLSRLYLVIYPVLALFFLYRIIQTISSAVFIYCFLTSSIWIPQIIRNAVRNTRKAYPIYYILVISIAKAFLPLYVYACPRNGMFGNGNNQTFAMIILAWLWIQVLVLITQYILGSRVFIPSGWLDDVYDYARVGKEGGDERCAICFERVGVGYMRTPCGHGFCGVCLEKWMETRMECPVCRQSLPDF
jgi:hypothetical protein